MSKRQGILCQNVKAFYRKLCNLFSNVGKTGNVLEFEFDKF